MKLTNEWLEKHKACKKAVNWVKKQDTRDEFELIKLCKEFDWINWYITERLDKTSNLKYAIAAANAAEADSKIKDAIVKYGIKLIKEMEEKYEIND